MDNGELSDALVTTMNSQALGTVAALSLVLYDYSLTLYDEVIFVWVPHRKPIHSGSLLFLWIRYYGLIELLFRAVVILSNTPGTFGIHIATIRPIALLHPSEALGFVLIFSVQIVLQIRVHVMYRVPNLSKFSLVFFLMEVVSIFAVWAIFPGGGDTDSQLKPFLREPSYRYIPLVLFEAWIGSLAFVKFVQRVVAHRKLPPGALQGGRDMVSVLFRDSAINYGLTLAVIAGFTIIDCVGHGDITNSGILEAGFMISGTRLILHLRIAYYGRGGSGEEDHAMSTNMRWRASGRSLAGLAEEPFWAAETE